MKLTPPRAMVAWSIPVCSCLLIAVTLSASFATAQESNDYYVDEPEAISTLAYETADLVSNSFLIEPVGYTVPLSRKGRFSRIRLPFFKPQNDGPSSNNPNAQGPNVPGKNAKKKIPVRRLNVSGTLENKLERCISIYKNKPEDIDAHSSWGCMHGALSLGKESTVLTRGRSVNAINWLMNNGSCRGRRMLYVSNGQLEVRLGPGFQGHEGQFLAILAQSGVGPREKIKVDGTEFEVVDLIKREMDSCKANTELTFKLIGLSYYLDSDGKWKSSDGQEWSIARLIAEEIKQPINGVACGGTHRLMGLSFTIQRRQIQKKSITGQWARAEKYIQDYVKYALSLQNSDGSFSTQWFEGRQMRQDIDRRLQTTGHIFEWLVYTVDKKSLTDPRIVRAANYLTSLMIVYADHDWEVGPRGHALRGIKLYYDKAFGAEPKIIQTERVVKKDIEAKPAIEEEPAEVEISKQESELRVSKDALNNAKKELEAELGQPTKKTEASLKPIAETADGTNAKVNTK